MAQHDYDISNQSFPAFRSDLNSVLEAINTSNSGTSRPSSAVAGTIWLDSTNATNPTLKFFDGSDDISLATLDYTANTVNWLDSTVSVNIVSDTTPQLGGDLDVNGNDIVSVANGNITITPDGTGKVIIDGLSYPTADGSADQVLKTDGSGNLSFTDVTGGTSWQSVKTSSFTAVAGEGYPCNTTSSAFTVTLPSSATAGDTIQLVDYTGTFNTNNITLTSSLNIEGSTTDKILTTNREGVSLTYVDASQGWVATSGVNSGNQALDPIPYDIDFLVIAGGGSGGTYRAGGGGAGGYRESTQTVTSGTVITVTVGDGGAGVTGIPNSGAGAGNSGSDSSISGSGLTTITSAGGGGGGTAPPSGVNGKNGGSGGGTGGGTTAGTGNTPSTSPSQGTNGGSGNNSAPHYGAGGGGGASVAGANASNTGGTNGGAGKSSSITGSAVTRAGGGAGGGMFSAPSTTGGAGGGGDAPSNSNGTAGTANTGGGGGGTNSTNDANPHNSGAGGKGVVILSVPTANYSSTTSGSPTVTTSGSNTILQFNGSGSYTT